MKLLYHKIEDEYSVFDAEIIELVRAKDIKITSPYLSLDYFNRIVNLSESWKLITDLEEWIKSSTIKARKEIIEIIRKNTDRIHHCSSLHSKLILSNKKAILGSANLTNKGICKNIELGIVYSDEFKVEEVTIWFDQLWNETTSVSIKELELYVKKVNEISIPNFDMLVLSCKKEPFEKKKIHVKEASKNPEPLEIDLETTEMELISSIKKLGNKERIIQYFDLVNNGS